jgi:NDP-sugar pyrophosphorylase family protein
MILAAGRGVRMQPLTDTLPKPMLPVAGRPALEHTLVWLHRHGVTDAIINLHHEPDRITNAFGDGGSLGMAITYSHEPSLLGTAGALKKVEGLLAHEAFIVVYGDVLTDLDLSALIAFHATRQPTAAATMALHEVDKPWECGVVTLDHADRLVAIEEKPDRAAIRSNLVNAGVLVIEPSALDVLPVDGPFDIAGDLLPRLLTSGRPVYGWRMPATSYLIDFGTPEKYARVQTDWPSRLAEVRP